MFVLDASLIVIEAIDSVMKSNNKGLLCELDIEKAYDLLFGIPYGVFF